MPKTTHFLSEQDEQHVIDAIKTAEKNTSGEIRVHIESTSKTKPFDRALEVFEELEMFKTAQRNGVLIYVAVADKSFAIYGDKGIHDVVPENFWNNTKDLMQAHFVKGEFKEALVVGILKAGEKLKAHFPWQTDDENELSNEISKG